jgi:hypothetical protein
VSRTEDGFGVFRSGGTALRTVLQGNYIHDLYYTCPNTFQSDNRSHCDGIQVHGNVIDLTIEGNNIWGFIDTAVSTWSTPTFDGLGVQQSGYEYYPRTEILSPIFMGVPSTTITDVLVTKNWLDGSAFSFVNMHPGWTAAATNYVISENRLGRSHAAAPDTYVFSMNASVNPTITGNYYADTGTPYNTRSNP